MPFFPFFISHSILQEEICRSLEEYNKGIEDLKERMDEATASSALIRDDIRELRTRCVLFWFFS